MDDSPSFFDWASLVADYLGPVATVVFGYWILRVTKRIESSQWKNQKLVEKRLEVWDKAGPSINAIYCYCRRIGSWKALTPPEVIQLKRDADQILYLNRPYFSGAFFKTFEAFMAVCFQTFGGHGTDARIKTEVWEHQDVQGERWESAWTAMLLDAPDNEQRLIRVYDDLLNAVRHEVAPGDED
jgi:hypothetical protein